VENNGRTLREWRELRGMSREELAEKSGVDEDMIARLEEVGDPVESGTIEGDVFARRVIGPILDALDAHDGIAIASVPMDVTPGHWVLDFAALSDLDDSIADFLVEHAGEIALRVAVPNRWGIGLKRFADVDGADAQAIVDYNRRQIRHSMRMVARLENNRALLQEHATDETQKMGEVFDERGGRWVPKPPQDPEE
jgi:transcriptional regulator with XRE-family HTH domain